MALRDLFRPKRKHSKGAVRAVAVKKSMDQPVLTKLVRTDVDWTVRRTAAKKLTDEALLAELAKTNEQWKHTKGDQDLWRRRQAGSSGQHRG